MSVFVEWLQTEIERNCCQLHQATMQMNRYFSGFKFLFAWNFAHAIVLPAIVTLKSFISHNHQECIFNISAQTSLFSLPLLVYIACNLFYIHSDSEYPSCGYWHKQIVNQAKRCRRGFIDRETLRVDWLKLSEALAPTIKKTGSRYVSYSIASTLNTLI